jgi:hypothetical protein
MIALNVFGPALKYRLDLLKDSSPNIKKYIHVLTDKISYEKFYQDFHNDYTFIFVEDYMNQYELSKIHEVIPNIFIDEEDHFTNSSEYYKSLDNFFSFDIHRFVIPYFISKGIKKFVIADSDMILTDDSEIVELFFNSIPEKSFFSPGMGTDYNLESKREFWKKLNIPNVSENYTIHENICLFDGWARGFNFDTIDDAQEFFNIWNESYLQLLENRKSPTVGVYKNGEGPLIWSNEWIFSHCVEIFKQLKGYEILFDVFYQPGYGVIKNISPIKVFSFHTPRPEDNLFHVYEKYIDKDGVERYPSRGSWYDYKFDYSGKKTVSSFLKNNKEEIEKYYKSFIVFDVEVTDTHAYTRIKK